jgi:hypothetical protein
MNAQKLFQPTAVRRTRLSLIVSEGTVVNF